MVNRDETLIRWKLIRSWEEAALAMFKIHVSIDLREKVQRAVPTERSDYWCQELRHG